MERIVELRLLSQEHAEKSNPRIWQITEEGKRLLKQTVENDLANSNIQVLLAEADDKIIGYVQGEITRRNDHMPKTVGQISLMYVVKQSRGKGRWKTLSQGTLQILQLKQGRGLDCEIHHRQQGS